MGANSLSPRDRRQRGASGGGPYRLPPRAEGPGRPGRPGRREPRDAEGALLLGLFALGCAPRAAAALLRGETFGAEATLCAAVFVTSAALLARALVRRRFNLPD